MRQGCSLFSLLFNIVQEFLARPIRQGEKINIIHIGKEIVKVTTFPDDMILYLKDTTNSFQKLLGTINTFIHVAGCKINKPFYTPTMNKLRKNIGKQFHLQ
jgi:hypothetical protein